MASVDGRRFYPGGSGLVHQHSCTPCKVDGRETEATYFCEVCSVHLCAQCRYDHNSFEATKDHSVIQPPVILDMKIESTKEVNIKSSVDSSDPVITGCAFLSNGSVLLCDSENSKVKLLDSDWSGSKSLELSDQPYNVAAVGEEEAIITFNNSDIKDLQYISTYPDLKLGKKITLPEQCWGLDVVNDEIYTAHHKSSGHDEIWKLDRSGNMKSKIVLTQSSSYGSEYLGLGSLTDHNPRVYLTDGNSRVACFQLDGMMVYQYEDKELKEPLGIYVDSAGNSLVCGYLSNNVVVITADGRKHRELLTSKNITHPYCIDFRPKDGTLIVGCEHNSK